MAGADHALVINDILLSAPSIVIGLFIYEVYGVGGAFLWLGESLACRVGDSGGGAHHGNMLPTVPNSLRGSRRRPGRAAMEGNHVGHPARASRAGA